MNISGVDAEGNVLVDLQEMSNNFEDCVFLPNFGPDCSFSPYLEVGPDRVHVLQRNCLDVTLQVDQDNGRYRAFWSMVPIRHRIVIYSFFGKALE
jgi:hypothetical protein